MLWAQQKMCLMTFFLKNIENRLLNFQVLIPVLKNSVGPVG